VSSARSTQQSHSDGNAVQVSRIRTRDQGSGAETEPWYQAVRQRVNAIYYFCGRSGGGCSAELLATLLAASYSVAQNARVISP